MHISWLGTTAIKIQTKPDQQDVIIAIDPYKPSKGSFPRSLTPDIGLYSRGKKDSITLSGNPFLLSTPGECEFKGVLMTAVQGEKAEEVKFRIDSEGMSLAHLGLTNKQLTEKELEVLSGVDILVVPFGNKNSYDSENAAKVVNAVEPRIVIPIGFKSENDPSAKPIDEFLKEMGISNGTPEKKVIIKKKDLPQEEIKVMVLAKE